MVQATDGGNPALTGSATVSITVTDVNDEDPVFTVSDVTKTVSENATVGSIVSYSC